MIIVIIFQRIKLNLLTIVVMVGTCFELTGGGGETSHCVTLTGIIWNKNNVMMLIILIIMLMISIIWSKNTVLIVMMSVIYVEHRQ